MSTPGPKPWQRVEDLFYQALDMPAEEQSVFLQQACGDDLKLRAEVESLIASADQGMDFLEQPLQQAARQVADDNIGPGSRIAAYQLIRVLGEGGMGKVYLAARADDQYSKQVAIKLVQSGLKTSTMLLRFRSERQILANLDHPNIARLMDGGVTPYGLPFLIMEYVGGLPIDKYCSRHALTVEQRLRLFSVVCSAVDYAHKNLVVHRDIKPANILVTTEGVPKLLDFGIAKLLDPAAAGALATRTAERMMTPEYASPEQVKGEPVTTSTDVYALGILLYELLAGERPFQVDSSSPVKLCQAICEQEPAPPSATARGSAHAAPEASRKLEGELDNIVLMALRKEPERRYRSVRELSDDIAAHLTGYPVRARTASWTYRSAKFFQRHKAIVFAAALLVLCLIGFSIAMGVLARNAKRQQAIAERESQFLSSIFQAASPEQARGKPITPGELLDSGVQRVDRELEGEPEVQAAMLDSIGRSYTALGLYDRAEPLMQRAYQLRKNVLGHYHLKTADSLDGLASVLRLQFQNAKAEGMFREALAIREKKLGSNHELVADSLTHLGDCLYVENKYEEAELVLRRAVNIYRGLGSDKGAATRNYLALVLERQGNFAEAAQLLREAVEIDKRTSGADSPSYAISLHNLAGTYIDMGDLLDAEATDRQALAILRTTLGNEHQELAFPLNNIAWILLEEGKWQAAEPILQEDLALTAKHGNQNTMIYGSAINNWGRVLQQKGDYAGAEHSYQQALAVMNALSGSSSWQAAKVLSNLSESKFDRGDYTAAEQYAEQVIEIAKKQGGAEHPVLASALIDMGVAKMADGNPEAAEPLLRQALAIRQKKFGPAHPTVLSAQVRLGEALVQEGKSDEAEQVLRQTLASAKASTFPLLAWQMAEIEHALGLCLHAEHRDHEADKLLAESRDGLRQHPRPTEAAGKGPRVPVLQ